MSYNLRLDIASDGDNAWPMRREFLAGQIAFHQPDIFGTQEGLPQQIDWLSERLHNYAYVGEGREGGHKGEYSALFYRKDLFQVVASGTFWLSETPDKVSKGWDAALPRICTWARLTNQRSGQSFYAFNTHLDHVGELARANSLKLIIRHIGELNTEGLPYVLTGDLNLTPETEPIQQLSAAMTDSYVAAPIKLGPAGTFTGFDYRTPATRRIDYVMVSTDPAIEVLRFATLTDAMDGHYPSDHFAVLAILRLPQ
jgi:endonuclease/exonuclease/phosphatase family metal-dependent hydrolase